MASKEDLEKFEAFFDSADKDKSGCLSITELRHALPKSGLDDQTIAEMFQDFDKDGDRKVTKAEFLKAMDKIPQSRLDEATLRKAFNDIDKDGSGTLDKDEVKKIVQSTGTKISDAAVESIIKQVDSDGDGKVNIKEFLALFRAK